MTSCLLVNMGSQAPPDKQIGGKPFANKHTNSPGLIINRQLFMKNKIPHGFSKEHNL